MQANEYCTVYLVAGSGSTVSLCGGTLWDPQGNQVTLAAGQASQSVAGNTVNNTCK